MTESQHQHSDRRLSAEVHYIQMAAIEEAIALGHPEVDIDHLLIALLSVGGPSAQALADSGTDLQAVRNAAAKVQEQHLAALGVTGQPQRVVTHAADRYAGLAVPINSRTQELLDGVPDRADDCGLLLALLEDDSRRARGVLEHAGVNVDELRERLSHEHVHTGVVPKNQGDRFGVGLRGPAPAGMMWMDASYSQILPVTADRVWALVSEPSRRPEWDATCTAVTATADAMEQLTHTNGHTVTQSVIRFEPGRAIAWREQRDEAADPATYQVLQLVLHPSGNTTGLDLQRSWLVPVRALGVRLSRPLLIRMIRTQLRLQAQGIAHAS